MPAKEIAQITSADFEQAIEYFKEFLINNEQLINDLNVYPVPDSDTGTNSLITLTAGIAGMAGSNVAQLAKSLSQNCAKAALGNSGIILAAYLSGIADELISDPITESVALSDWQRAMTKAAEYSKNAVLYPSQGTMLTIADAVASENESDLTGQLLTNATVARLALGKTTEMLPSLTEAGVVDSGAVVLTLFHDAFAKLITGSNFTELQIENTECKVKPDYQGPSHELMFQVNLASEKKDQLLKQLSELGDSISTAQIESNETGLENLRIHIHCDDPDRVLIQAKLFGQVSDLVLLNLTLKNI